jgi:hypothetical protein
MGDYTDFDAQPGSRSGGGGGGFLKFCLICGCILLALLAAGGGFVAYQASQLLTMDPVKVVTKVENDILPGSDVPSNYVGLMAMKIPGAIEFAVVVPQGMQQQANQNQVGLVMFVCAMPAGANQKQMQQQMQASMQGQGGGNTQIQVEAENEKVLKIRGQDTTFTEIIGSDNNGVQMKQLIGVVPRTAGSGDQVMLMFMGKADIFDQAAVDAFLSSIN